LSICSMPVTILRAVDTVVSKTDMTSALRELTLSWRMIDQTNKLISK